ncbi:MAG TPA: aminotransferase class V-fold PLP-dependent enzyme [Anaeromyxobacteraceae bacterium]|nr:aminotransferase class V-fold PLP-dependent enzyme [Anaeromyxobacteraceae bacterium]
MIYLDHAATSFPKAPGVAEAMAEALAVAGGNPGRSGHRLSLAAQAVLEDARRRVAALLGAPEPSRVVFGANATDGLNQALWGLLRPGDRVLASAMEHNAVARPLAALAERGVRVERVPCGPDGTLDPDDLARALRAVPTRLVALVHASNVCGTLLPAREAARLAHDHGALLLLDAAQTAGAVPIDVRAWGVDLLACPGHKALLGPTGTGVLWVAPGVSLEPRRQGGTGIRSEDERPPTELPEGLEAGTPNVVGLAGLAAAVRWLQERGVAAVREHERALTARLLAALRDAPGVRVHGVADAERQTAVVSVTLAGWDPQDAAAALESSFGVAVRAGLHCAPWAHRTLGTFPAGTVRLSAGISTTADEVDAAAAALRRLGASPP